MVGNSCKLRRRIPPGREEAPSRQSGQMRPDLPMPLNGYFPSLAPALAQGEARGRLCGRALLHVCL